MREDVSALLARMYERTVSWQRSKDVVVELTLAEYVAKWSRYRLNKLAEEIDKGGITAYLRNPDRKPVCGWVSREARETGLLTAANCSIQRAVDQRRLFQNKPGDRLSEETLARMRKPKAEKHRANMRKPKTDKARANMKEAARQRWANVRAATGRV